MRAGGGLLAGMPVPSVRVAIVTDRWSTSLGPWTESALEQETLPPASSGEIIVSGDHVLTGYLDGRGDEETKVRVGDRIWHRTGDAGYLDAAGRLWLLGRCSAKVDDEHGRVYPFAVECAASEIDGIARTAFVRRRGQRVLVAELAGDVPMPDVLAMLRERLAWAGLARAMVVPRIPVDGRHNAKVDYPALEAMLEKLEHA
jgi:acyl-CoA synthetase (AMP-forming)/AMP-acid ligase II